MAEATDQVINRLRNLKDASGNRYYAIQATASTNETITMPAAGAGGLTTINGVSLTANEDVAVKCTYTGAIITITSTHTDKVISGIVWGV